MHWDDEKDDRLFRDYDTILKESTILTTFAGVLFGFLLNISVRGSNQLIYPEKVILVLSLFSITIAISLFVMPVIYHHLQFPYTDIDRFKRRAHRFIIIISNLVERLSNLDHFYEHVTDDLRYVLLREAFHGTSEFYNWSIEITKRLITEHNFSFIAVEGDWSDCYKVNRYVKGKGKGKGRSETNGLKSAYDVLYSFNRWPTWMWANREMVSFIEWLRHYNDNERHSDEEKVGFYGLDVYSLWESLEAVIKYLKRVDPSAIKKAVEAFQCFEPYAMSVEDYARTALFVPESCEDEVISMLIQLR
jgi:erythromycin esterase/uncharacterized protein DUF6328